MSPGTATRHVNESQASLPQSITDRFAHNLEALAALQPELAQTLSSLSVPGHVTPTTGRDGSATFRLRAADGRLIWFGQSSMPTISAREMLGGMQRDGGSAALPGVLTGLEPIVVAERLPEHGAVFVLEAEPLNLKLALHLYDYGSLLEAGRIVFLLTSDLDREFIRFTERHPSYEVPSFLYNLAQCSAAQIAELQGRLERAGRAVVEMQARLMTATVDVLRARSFESVPDTPRLAVVSVDPGAVACETAHRVRRAAERSNWSSEVAIPDHPARCHVVARLRAIERARADFVLFIGRGAETMRPLLPEALPVATRLVDDRPVDATALGALGPHDVVFVSDPEAFARMDTDDVEGGSVFQIEPAADDTTFRPIDLTSEERRRLETDVALIGDLPDDRPEACGITLTSHVSLWETAQQIARRTADEGGVLAPEIVFEEPSRATGVSLDDPTIRDGLLGLIRSAIIPAAAAHGLAATIASAGVSVSVWGANWGELESKRTRRMGTIPTDAELNRIFNAAALAVFPNGGARCVQHALDALCAGTPVALCDAEASFRRRYPKLGKLASNILFIENAKVFRETARQCIANPDRNDIRTARDLIVREHSVAARLRWLCDCLRSRRRGRRPVADG